MKVKIFTTTSLKEKNLKNVYDVCNKVFKDNKCFYTCDDLNKLKQDKTNVFLILK